MFMPILLISSGAIVGALLRYAASLYLVQSVFVVNVLGSLLMGFLATKFLAFDSQNLSLFFCVGLLGSFTTFSAYSYEVLTLINTGQLVKATGYAVFSVLCCVLACAMGSKIAQYL